MYDTKKSKIYSINLSNNINELIGTIDGDFSDIIKGNQGIYIKNHKEEVYAFNEKDKNFELLGTNCKEVYLFGNDVYSWNGKRLGEIGK
ncbi:MAG: hypothetical protein Q8865_09440 [Bacillota bacterium]|nr:hypothetical protein [Bacillota bacterium]